MNKYIKTILIISGALSVGLLMGYLLFGNNTSMSITDEHNHSDTAIETAGEEEIWTCSMHPQIRQNEPGECPICGMDLIPLAANSSNDPLVLEMTNEAVKLASIQTTVVGQSTGSTAKTLRLSGKIQADERLASSQVAHVPGRIEKLYVSFTGEEIRKGQKLADLYSPELITAQRELLEALKLQAVNPGLIEAARNKLRFWKISKETIDKIEREAQIQEIFPVYADESGIVMNRRVAVGDYLKQGEPLFSLMNLRSVWVLFDAYEEDISHISIGNNVSFSTPAIPNRTFQARVTFIDPVINPQTRVASVRVEVQNTKGVLKPEMLVYGTLENKTLATTNLTIPKSAVLWTGPRSVVYVKVPDRSVPSFQFREVEIGDALGENYQLISGVEAGEEIVTYGNFAIDAAAQLNNQASMMNRDVMLKGADHSEHLPDYTSVSPADFKQQLAEVTASYLLLKDAFVATNVALAGEQAAKLVASLGKVDMALLDGDAHLYWMEQLSAMEAHTTQIQASKEIEQQRTQFSFLSQALIKSLKVFGVPESTYYVQHCPMANDNEGADWLSREEQVQNPYFGDKMLTCGTVQETITKNFKNPAIEATSTPRMTGHNH